MNFSELAKNLDLEEEDYMELVQLLVETTWKDLESIEAAIVKKHPDEAANALHSIKGATGNLGLMDLHELAKEGETAARNNTLDRISEILQELKTKMNSLAELAGL